MTQYTLTQVEVSGIQDYVFGGNNLRQNIGASELVARSTTQWIVKALDQTVGEDNHNTRWSDEVGFVEFVPTPANAKAEVVYAGGGNALILFAGGPEENAYQFTKKLTRRVLKEARNLNMIVDHLDFDRDRDVLSTTHQTLRRQISRRKLSKRPDTPLLGLGVTAAGDYSGAPAVGLDDHGHPISVASLHKLNRSEPLLPDDKPNEQRNSANYRLRKVLGDSLRDEFQFVRDFDLFGEKGESSYIAVVHIDGNGMGRRFQGVAAAHPNPEDNEAYVKQLRAMSKSVQEKSIDALKTAVELVFQGVDDKKIPLKHGKQHLPFRPIVFGGDDTTFVTDGRYGMALAVKYLETLAQGEMPGEKAGQTGDPFYARAGIAIVKTHYPFSRAYELAESLAKSAKKSLETVPDEKGITLDWHIANSGVILSLDELREREYRADTGNSLLMRPLRLDLGDAPAGSQYWRSWRNFDAVAHQRQLGKYWADRRNKVLALREHLRRGGGAVLQFRKNLELAPLPEIKTQSQMAETGWSGEDCGYFDVIEALEFYTRL